MKNLIPYLKNATALPEYKQLLEFGDGIKGVIDILPWKGQSAFSYWKDEANLKSFTIIDNKN